MCLADDFQSTREGLCGNSPRSANKRTLRQSFQGPQWYIARTGRSPVRFALQTTTARPPPHRSHPRSGEYCPIRTATARLKPPADFSAEGRGRLSSGPCEILYSCGRVSRLAVFVRRSLRGRCRYACGWRIPRDRLAAELAIQLFVSDGRFGPAELARHGGVTQLRKTGFIAENVNARPQAASRDLAENCENRKPVTPSSIVSASPPVACAIGSDP